MDRKNHERSAAISVIIPFYMKNVYRRGMSEGHSPLSHAYLADCLESICAQNREDVEVLLVEDGKSEAIDEVKEAYKERLTLRCFRIPHGGVGAARNEGLARARGEFVYFLDADDYLADGVFDRLLALSGGKDLSYGAVERTWFKRAGYLAERESREEQQPEQQRQPPQRFENPAAWLTRPGALASGLLIRRAYLEREGIRLDETLELYPDLPFLARLLGGTDRIGWDYDAIYVKRIHNDEVQYPSLSQQVREDRTMQYVRAYRAAKEAAAQSGQEEVGRGLDRGLYAYILKAFTGRLHDQGRVVWKPEEYAVMKEAMALADPSLRREYSPMRRRILKAIAQGDDKRAIRAGNVVVAVRKRRELLKNSRLLFRIIDRYLFQKLPIKEHMVFFESFFGNSYSDSPKYIYQYLLETYGSEYRYIWVLKDKRKRHDIPGNPIVVTPYSLRYFYYLARSKYWILNIRLPKWIEKKQGHVCLQTWHGTPLKKLVFDMEDVHLASSRSSYKMIFYQETKKWDYLISANRFSTDKFESAFLYDRSRILEIGYPRNDCLKAEDRQERAAEVRRRLGIPESKILILYAPTWRDDEYYEAGSYKFDLKLDLAQMQKELGDRYAVLLRTHYLIAQNLRLDGLEGFAYNVSAYDDISELYLISDLCITDYSSVFFDYANLRRPILFYVYDLDKYRDVLRGFYINIETEVPGPLLYSTQEVIGAIQNIDGITKQYQERYDRFYERFCSLDDGHASERAVRAVFGRESLSQP